MLDDRLFKERAKRLREARIKAGFRLAVDATKAFGWNENTYRSHENGNRSAPFPEVEKYARAYKVDPIYIWKGTLEPTTEALADSVWVGLKSLPSDKQEFVLSQLKTMIDGLLKIP